MTEAEWLACTDPPTMLQFLRKTASDRKLRLFAIACCRRVWNWLGEKSQGAVEVVERYVDGETTDDDLYSASRRAEEDWISEFGNHHPSNAAYLLSRLRTTTSHDLASWVAAEIVEAVRCEANISKGLSPTGRPLKADPVVIKACIEAAEAAKLRESTAQCHLLRDIFHGPRRAILIRGSWKSLAVHELARQIYSEKTFHRLLELAKVLVKSGCDNNDFLQPFLDGEEHVRGCWFLDVLLGKA